LILAGRVTAQSAAPIPTLFNTGVSANNSNGSPATLTADGANDQHYSIIAGVDGAISPFVTESGSYPFPYGSQDTATSKWISPQAMYAGFLQDPVGIYTYRTTFDLTSFDITTASISGQLAVDNAITAVRINGFDIGYSYIPSTFNLHTFSLPNGHYISGVNAIEFDVTNYVANGGNPSGFRVELNGTASPVTAFQITSIVLTNAKDLLITWNTSGTNNIVQVSAGMGAKGSFSTNGFTDLTNIVVTTTTTNFWDVGATTNRPARYYRIRSPQ
jgi:hypothetical protein